MELPRWCTQGRDGTLLGVVARPRSSREAVGPALGDRLKVSVHAPPADDKANRAIARVIAEALGVPPSGVRVVAGRSGRRKTILVEGLDAATVAERIVSAAGG